MSKLSHAQEFIRYLESLNPEKNEKAKRADLAQLKRSLAFDVGTYVPAISHVERFAPSKEDTPWFTRPAYYLVAGLYASYPNHSEEQGNFGRTVALLNQAKESDSISKRFLTLLEAEDEQMYYHMRHMLSLVRSEGIAVNYVSLLEDLRNWGHPDKFVQQRWAQRFYNPYVAKDNQEEPTLEVQNAN